MNDIKYLDVLGEGVWSDASYPIIMHNAPKAPKMPDLVTLYSLPEVLQQRERFGMNGVDWNTNVSQYQFISLKNLPYL